MFVNIFIRVIASETVTVWGDVEQFESVAVKCHFQDVRFSQSFYVLVSITG